MMERIIVMPPAEEFGFAVQLITHLQQNGDPAGMLPRLWAKLEGFACLVCLDSAAVFNMVSRRMRLPPDIKQFIDLCLDLPHSQQARQQAFRFWLDLQKESVEMIRESVAVAKLHPSVRDSLLPIIDDSLLALLNQNAETYGDLILQVLGTWYFYVELVNGATEVLHFASFGYLDPEALEAFPLPPSYVAALAKVPDLPLVDDNGRTFGDLFQRALNREQRIDRNPGGTGRKREREVAESSIVSDEEPSPLELAPDPHTPDPAEVVADEDAVERVLAQFGERTAQLLRLCLQGYSLSEAAQQLGIAPSTAWNLLQRARKKLRKT
jgi:RNA polymerase sigma factor (sigma-70 family)